MKLSGRRNVLELIRNDALCPQIEEIIICPTQLEIKKLCELKKIPFAIKPKEWFKQEEAKNKYQFAIAHIAAKTQLDFNSFLQRTKKQEKNMVLVLDRIQDPHNFGAILRTAAAFGVCCVIVQTREQCPINYTVLKVSQGYALQTTVIEVNNLNQASDALKKHGFWIYASSLSPEAKDHKTVMYHEKSVLIMGSEGGGISRLLLKNSDYQIKIPLSHAVDSLNVSVALGILLFK